MKDLQTGVTGTSELTVNSENLAVNVGSGSLEVFATPHMIMLMEKAACSCISDYLPEHVADAVAFMASEQSAYITGQVLGVNGGMVI